MIFTYLFYDEITLSLSRVLHVFLYEGEGQESHFQLTVNVIMG